MKISRTVAGEIVEQLSLDINQGINIMDKDGMIIASSDKERVGQLHAGARKLLEEKLPNLIIEDNDQYAGSRCGVNLPIFIDGEALGVIGITGAVSEVFQYGNIIKRMTEIMLLDRKLRDQEIIEQKARDRFFDEWVLGRLEEYNPAEFLRMAETLGIRTEDSFRVAVITVQTELSINDATLTEISRYVRRYVKNAFGASAFRTATKMVCLIEEGRAGGLSESAALLSKEILRLYGYKAYIGISNAAFRLHLNEGFVQADAALSVALKRDEAVTVYDEFDLDFILNGVSERVCQKYLRRLFRDAADEEIEKYMAFAEIYLSCDGSLTEIAERLFVHKNTVKYKINRLREISGVDIRTCEGCYIFSLVVRLYRAV